MTFKQFWAEDWLRQEPETEREAAMLIVIKEQLDEIEQLCRQLKAADEEIEDLEHELEYWEQKANETV